MNPEAEFYRKLAVLAKLCRNFELDAMIVESYDVALSATHSYDQLCAALDRILEERDSNDPFPSIKQIRAALNPNSDPETEATDAAARIVESVGRDGWTNSERARSRMGELAWSVVQSEGGWQTVCEQLNEKNKTGMRAQWKNIAKAKLLRKAAGLEDSTPRLSSDPKPLVSVDQLMKLAHQKREENK